MKKISILAVMVAIIGLGKAGNAQIVSTMGGALVPLNTRMLDLATGYPSALFVRYHIPIMKKMELAPFFTFDYGFDTAVPVVGDRLGILIKYNLYDTGKFKISLGAEPGLGLSYHPFIGFAIDLGLPEVLMTYVLNNKLAFDFGLKMPISFVVHPNFTARIPILFNLGAEFNLMKNMNLLMSVDLGPDILAFNGGSITRFRANILMGISYRF